MIADYRLRIADAMIADNRGRRGCAVIANHGGRNRSTMIADNRDSFRCAVVADDRGHRGCAMIADNRNRLRRAVVADNGDGIAYPMVTHNRRLGDPMIANHGASPGKGGIAAVGAARANRHSAGSRIARPGRLALSMIANYRRALRRPHWIDNHNWRGAVRGIALISMAASVPRQAPSRESRHAANRDRREC
jgi:hypothetical protein